MTVDRRADRALYLQLADVLRDEITTGQLGPGDRLPSETELISRHDISRGTVRDAIGILRSEGLVLVEHGRGAFVRTTDHPRYRRTVTDTSPPLPFRDAFKRDATAQGHKPSIRELEASPQGDAPVELKLANQTDALRADLLCFIDGRPVQTVTTWQPPDASTGDLTGIAEELTARMPTRTERRLLQLDDGAPVIELTRTLHGADGAPVEISRAVVVADRHTLAYTFTARDDVVGSEDR